MDPQAESASSDPQTHYVEVEVAVEEQGRGTVHGHVMYSMVVSEEREH